MFHQPRYQRPVLRFSVSSDVRVTVKQKIVPAEEQVLKIRRVVESKIVSGAERVQMYLTYALTSMNVRKTKQLYPGGFPYGVRTL